MIRGKVNKLVYFFYFNESQFLIDFNRYIFWLSKTLSYLNLFTQRVKRIHFSIKINHKFHILIMFKNVSRQINVIILKKYMTKNLTKNNAI